MEITNKKKPKVYSNYSEKYNNQGDKMLTLYKLKIAIENKMRDLKVRHGVVPVELIKAHKNVESHIETLLCEKYYLFDDVA